MDPDSVTIVGRYPEYVDVHVHEIFCDKLVVVTGTKQEDGPFEYIESMSFADWLVIALREAMYSSTNPSSEA